jgi:hypothetical protein
MIKRLQLLQDVVKGLRWVPPEGWLRLAFSVLAGLGFRLSMHHRRERRRVPVLVWSRMVL